MFSCTRAAINANRGVINECFAIFIEKFDSNFLSLYFAGDK